jgi:hypothetical protein
MRRIVASGAAALLVVAARAIAANQAPEIDHHPSPCTLADQAISLCASISDDGQVAHARIWFRREGETFYSFVEMSFGGLNYCGTLPAPRAGKVQKLEYYIQAIDEQFEAARTSTYLVQVQPEGTCEFPPLEKDAARRAAITVYASNKKQGKKVPDGFEAAGVTFVPIEGK